MNITPPAAAAQQQQLVAPKEARRVLYDERNARFLSLQCPGMLYVYCRRFSFECATCTKRCAAFYAELPLVDIRCCCPKHAEGSAWPKLSLSPLAHTLLMPKKLLFVPLPFTGVEEMVQLANAAQKQLGELVVINKLPIVPLRTPLLVTMLWGPATVQAVTSSWHLFVHYHFTLQLINAKVKRMVLSDKVAAIIEVLQEINALDKSSAAKRAELDAELAGYEASDVMYAGSCYELYRKVTSVTADYRARLQQSLLAAAADLSDETKTAAERAACFHYVAVSCVLSLEHMLLEICGFPPQYAPYLTVPKAPVDGLLPEHTEACDAEARNLAVSIRACKLHEEYLSAHEVFVPGPGGKKVQLKADWRMPAAFTHECLAAVTTARDFNERIIGVVLRAVHQAELDKKLLPLPPPQTTKAASDAAAAADAVTDTAPASAALGTFTE